MLTEDMRVKQSAMIPPPKADLAIDGFPTACSLSDGTL